MEELIKLSDNIIDQIKDFIHWKLTKKQELSIDKLILNEEIKERYKLYGLCKECNQLNTNMYYLKGYKYWCQSCNAKHFQQNFKNWTSENRDIDDFIQKSQLKAKNHKEVLEWIDYDKFENIKYLAKGGYGTTYKATWKDGYVLCRDSENNRWERWGENDTVALKCIRNSKDITPEFFREFESYNSLLNDSDRIVQCYGITKDPKTNDLIIVMKYVPYGNLRQYLNNSHITIDWKDKLWNLYTIAYGLSKIHNNGLIHRNFHSGNILNNFMDGSLITDFGLYKPANEEPSQSDSKKIYGVLPYVAPEVLREKNYTQASDIYGFGIIAYEICTGLLPYHNVAHDESLAIKICQGLRPESNYKIPQLILEIIKQCWDSDPSKRPEAEELSKLLENLWDVSYSDHENISLINNQFQEANEANEKSTVNSSHVMHPKAIYISRLLDFKNLPESKNADVWMYDDDSFEII